MRFRVEDRVFEALPGVCFGIVIAKGIDNSRAYPLIDQMLELGIKAAEERFRYTKVKDDPSILPYREAFTKLNMNPNKFMSSIEAMFTRVAKGKGLPRINPIVDLGNALSLKYVLPMGAHDIDSITGDLEVRFSKSADSFLPFGEAQREEMPEGELVYATGSEVRTRRWIWRQSEIGKIHLGSRNIFFPIDGFYAANHEAVLAAQAALQDALKRAFGCETRLAFVNQDHPEIVID